MRIYGLTGGIASGKSEVAKRFEEMGIPVINADNIGHELIEPGGAAAEAVIEAFGKEITSHGRIDREKVGALVFASKAALDRLNSIVHPALKRIVAEKCRELAGAGHKLAVIDAALIAEDGKKEAWLDGLIVVISSRDIRLGRLVNLRGMTPDQANGRIDAQTPPETKAPIADWVVENNGTLAQLRARAEQVAKELLHRAG